MIPQSIDEIRSTRSSFAASLRLDHRMRKFLILVLGLTSFVELRATERGSFGGIQLLDGYRITRRQDVDAQAGSIEKTGRLKINFECGMSEGAAVKPQDKATYLWYQEQILKGHKSRFALERAEKGGNGRVLEVTFLLGDESSAYACNFAGHVRNQSDVAEMLLMVLTFDPTNPF